MNKLKIRFYRCIRRFARRIVWWAGKREMMELGTYDAFVERWRKWQAASTEFRREQHDEVHTP